MPDSRVATAISHWAPRFVANGVDYNDFLRVAAQIETWESWCDRWCAAAAEHEELGRAALASDHGLSAGAHLARSATYYHFAKVLCVDDLAQMRAAWRSAVRHSAVRRSAVRRPGARACRRNRVCVAVSPGAGERSLVVGVDKEVAG